MKCGYRERADHGLLQADRLARRAVCVLFLGPLLTLGCQSSLPSPIECEDMVHRALGRSAREIRMSPLGTKVKTRLVYGCLTVPFDFKAVNCIQEGYGFVRCIDDLAQREPSRRAALEKLALDLSELLPADGTKFLR